ncbi:uncharacterized protein MONOS_10426 [Monocercomonoides exilis]|uniref:uncharacterized protein n=1 Tax=Monocercomonoides exilis TaxID=2049356 RepID=UPI003559AB02|nr:hypothetical protein MONOS_10426 [Monocercomonoides exilis]|eukprot:MONOS_10426.1-p1 / transcript=MONOS_10426.1 / gene=MONOS_10426 / organism=Monocercomonoides_exilis_PA203 / gene_product=unspecified product / transcript_product=unspecified product / location=Mono_scaffold00474:15213-18992(-) / protein_length=1259 / sequence_SO=supercontig / SO=protein_coding / is_pseudo=false
MTEQEIEQIIGEEIHENKKNLKKPDILIPQLRFDTDGLKEDEQISSPFEKAEHDGLLQTGSVERPYDRQSVGKESDANDIKTASNSAQSTFFYKENTRFSSNEQLEEKNPEKTNGKQSYENKDANTTPSLPFLRSSRRISSQKMEKKDDVFRCPKMRCYKIFATQKELEEHMKTHSRSNMYHCTWEGCNQFFPTKVKFMEHVAQHTGELPFRCDVPNCEKAFDVRVKYTRHMRAAHGIDVRIKKTKDKKKPKQNTGKASRENSGKSDHSTKINEGREKGKDALKQADADIDELVKKKKKKKKRKRKSEELTETELEDSLESEYSSDANSSAEKDSSADEGDGDEDDDGEGEGEVEGDIEGDGEGEGEGEEEGESDSCVIINNTASSPKSIVSCSEGRISVKEDKKQECLSSLQSLQKEFMEKAAAAAAAATSEPSYSTRSGGNKASDSLSAKKKKKFLRKERNMHRKARDSKYDSGAVQYIDSRDVSEAECSADSQELQFLGEVGRQLSDSDLRRVLFPRPAAWIDQFHLLDPAFSDARVLLPLLTAPFFQKPSPSSQFSRLPYPQSAASSFKSLQFTHPFTVPSEEATKLTLSSYSLPESSASQLRDHRPISSFFPSSLQQSNTSSSENPFSSYSQNLFSSQRGLSSSPSCSTSQTQPLLHVTSSFTRTSDDSSASSASAPFTSSASSPHFILPKKKKFLEKILGMRNLQSKEQKISNQTQTPKLSDIKTPNLLGAPFESAQKMSSEQDLKDVQVKPSSFTATPSSSNSPLAKTQFSSPDTSSHSQLAEQESSPSSISLRIPNSISFSKSPLQSSSSSTSLLTSSDPSSSSSSQSSFASDASQNSTSNLQTPNTQRSSSSFNRLPMEPPASLGAFDSSTVESLINAVTFVTKAVRDMIQLVNAEGEMKGQTTASEKNEKNDEPKNIQTDKKDSEEPKKADETKEHKEVSPTIRTTKTRSGKIAQKKPKQPRTQKRSVRSSNQENSVDIKEDTGKLEMKDESKILQTEQKEMIKSIESKIEKAESQKESQMQTGVSSGGEKLSGKQISRRNSFGAGKKSENESIALDKRSNEDEKVSNNRKVGSGEPSVDVMQAIEKDSLTAQAIEISSYSPFESSLEEEAKEGERINRALFSVEEKSDWREKKKETPMEKYLKKTKKERKKASVKAKSELPEQPIQPAQPIQPEQPIQHISPYRRAASANSYVAELVQKRQEEQAHRRIKKRKEDPAKETLLKALPKSSAAQAILDQITKRADKKAAE